MSFKSGFESRERAAV